LEILLSSHRSYGLMRQSCILPPFSMTYKASLCRLLSIPAGYMIFPTLSLQSLCRRKDPYPVVPLCCDYPLLHRERRLHIKWNTFSAPENPCYATSAGSRVSRLQSFVYLQAPTFARPPYCSHRSFNQAGQPGRLHHAIPGWLPAPGCGIATCPTWAIDTVGLPPTGLQPCRLLLHSHGSSPSKAAPVIGLPGLLDEAAV
jgi:hypothetical protein